MTIARATRLEIYERLGSVGVLPLFYHPDLDVAVATVRACAEGGATVIEFADRGERVLRLFADLAERVEAGSPKVILGVGSVVDAHTAAAFIDAGASFIVGPSLDRDTAFLCNRHRIAYLPGCGSVAEIVAAEELGAEIVKVFPANALGGPEYLRTILGPRPRSRLMPTGGVTASEESIRSWIAAGATCVGIGSDLIRPGTLRDDAFLELTDRTRAVVGWARSALDERAARAK